MDSYRKSYEFRSQLKTRFSLLEKRHRSSSSLAGVLEGVRSEKRLDVRASIPEVDDQFAIAEARCDSLQEKIDLVKALKRKKKMKKRSMTTITEPTQNMENVPMITIRTRPKKKTSQQTDRIRLESNTRMSNPTIGYVDPDVIEQRRMLNNVQGYNQIKQQQNRLSNMKPNRDTQNVTQNKLIYRDRADGDSEQGSISPKLSYGDEPYDNKTSNRPHTYYRQGKGSNSKVYYDSRPQSKQLVEKAEKRNRTNAEQPVLQRGTKVNEKERRQVVELFSKHRRGEKPLSAGQLNREKNTVAQSEQKAVTESMDNITLPKVKKPKVTRNIKNRRRHYELPTVSSKMKRVYFDSQPSDVSHANMPFVVSKSLAPSHNVGVNLQQILNGLKLQQPLSKIPPTIAHQMGLRHVPTRDTRSAPTHATLKGEGMNVIKLGARLVHVPSLKAMSYSRLLALYRAGNSVVARFLSTAGRRHCYYTSMYDLSTKTEDIDGATSKGQGSHAAKQSLAEYASLYREYEQVEKLLNEDYDPELEKHKENLAKKLAERENYIRMLVRDSGAELDAAAFRTSVSAEED